VARHAVLFRKGQTAHAVTDLDTLASICGKPVNKTAKDVFWASQRRSAVTCQRCHDSIWSGRTKWEVSP
jgi:hypothetical protein